MKTKMILNIGLESGSRFKNKLNEVETLNLALNLLNNIKINYSFKIEKSKSENTLIVHLDQSLNKNLIVKLSMITKQDCIAVFDVEKQEGDLVGKFKNAWGVFNKDYFLM